MKAQKYVVYYRVSTRGQELGLDAQQASVEAFLKTNNSEEIPPAFTEVESGKNNKRLELRKAVDQCKKTGAILLIAKLDRLSRNAAFTLLLKEELQKAGTDFRAVDMPEMNTLMLTVMAGMAQQEREYISRRTKEGLQAAKARGQKLGSPKPMNREVIAQGHAAISRYAREDVTVRHAWHYIKSLKADGLSYKKIAERLNEEGYPSRTGKQFYASSVRNIYNRFAT